MWRGDAYGATEITSGACVERLRPSLKLKQPMEFGSGTCWRNWDLEAGREQMAKRLWRQKLASRQVNMDTVVEMESLHIRSQGQHPL